ncbi:GNAT family N-acetyltransferase [Marinobacter hydrocarbonoclasticus]|nr:GNAT family N-acetyltransferase [Marinobacter nauticus]
MPLELRTLSPDDDAGLAQIIREALTEFGANRPGFAWADPELDQLSKVYSRPDHHYLVALLDGELVGGAGIAPFACHLPRVCELQKMYLSPRARGQGVGQALMEAILAEAVKRQYQHCYLETFGPMTGAQKLYQAHGFLPLSAPWGESGHTACDRWFSKTLEARK